MSEPWFRLELRDDASVPLVIAARAPHLGAAIELARKKHPRHRLIAAATGAAMPPIGDSVSKEQVILAEEALLAPDVLALPPGLVRLAVPDGSSPPLTVGWVRRETPDVAVVIEAQPDPTRIHETWMRVIERLPSADNIEVMVRDPYDRREPAGAPTGGAAWLTSRIDAKKALRFLDDHDDILTEHGHVRLSLYVRASRSTLRLTEAKTLVWISEDQATVAAATGWFDALGLPALPSLTTAADVPHLRYRGSRAGDRTHLEERLYQMRLRIVPTGPS